MNDEPGCFGTFMRLILLVAIVFSVAYLVAHIIDRISTLEAIIVQSQVPK